MCVIDLCICDLGIYSSVIHLDWYTIETHLLNVILI